MKLELQLISKVNEFERRRSWERTIALAVTLGCLLLLASDVFTQTKKEPDKAPPVKARNLADEYEDKWSLFTANEDGEKRYLNAGRTTRRGDFVRIWTQTLTPQDRLIDRFLVEIDCDERKLRTLASVRYIRKATAPDKSVIWPALEKPISRDTPDAPFIHIVPETMGDTLATEACRL